MATLAEFTQKVPRKSIKCWALSGLFTKQKVPRILKKCKQTRQGQEFDRVPGHFLGKFWFVYTFFQTLGTFCCVNISERAQNLIEFLGTFWVNSANVASPLSVQTQEPRGYPCTNIDVIYPSSLDGIEWGYVIIEQGSVYPMFSGHNTICVVTALLVHPQNQLVSLKCFETCPLSFSQ